MAVFTEIKKEDLEKITGFSSEKVKTVYEISRMTGPGVTLILYSSGKLLIQGKTDAVKKVVMKLNKLKIGKKINQEQFKNEKGWMIGTDESLKGDTFGGLVVAGVKADDKLRKELLQLGVADSKCLSDQEVLNMAEKIKIIAPCEISSLLPEEYNNNGNITNMLNKLHKYCADFLSPGKHVVDKYPGCNVGDVQEEKAESKYIEVAAASVLARAAALKQLEYLSVQAGFKIPKGSTHVRLALHELEERKLDSKQFIKVNFSNVKQFFSLSD